MSSMCKVQVLGLQSKINHKLYSIENYKWIFCFKHKWKYLFFFKIKSCVGPYELTPHCPEENFTPQATEEQEMDIHCKSPKGLKSHKRIIALDFSFSIEERQQFWKTPRLYWEVLPNHCHTFSSPGCAEHTGNTYTSKAASLPQFSGQVNNRKSSDSYSLQIGFLHFSIRYAISQRFSSFFMKSKIHSLVVC